MLVQKEDEEDILKRKMKEEEEEINIDGVVDDTMHRNGQIDGMEIEDEDFSWADQEKKDMNDFKMRIVMQEDSEV